jgi:hypothetical protein
MCGRGKKTGCNTAGRCQNFRARPGRGRGRRSANRKRVCGNSWPKGGKLDVRTAKLPTNHRRDPGCREAHRKRVQDATRLSAACSTPFLRLPRKALPSEPCWRCLERLPQLGFPLWPLRLDFRKQNQLRIPCAPPPRPDHTQNKLLLILRRGAGCVIVGESSG